MGRDTIGKTTKAGGIMSKWIACGSFVDPKRAREFIRFTSKLDYETEGEAEREAQEWREGGREYKYIWVEQTR
jgi:hypothetical protein